MGEPLGREFGFNGVRGSTQPLQLLVGALLDAGYLVARAFEGDNQLVHLEVKARSLRRCPLGTICVRVIEATDRIRVKRFSPALPVERNKVAQKTATSTIDRGLPDRSAARPATVLPHR